MCPWQEASILIKQAEMEEKKLHKTTLEAHKKAESVPGKDKTPPPPPTLISRTDHSLTFSPAPYDSEGQVRFAFKIYPEYFNLTKLIHTTFLFSHFLYLFSRWAGISFMGEWPRALTWKCALATTVYQELGLWCILFLSYCILDDTFAL